MKMIYKIVETKCPDTGVWSADLCHEDQNENLISVKRVTAESVESLLKKKSEFYSIVNQNKQTNE